MPPYYRLIQVTKNDFVKQGLVYLEWLTATACLNVHKLFEGYDWPVSPVSKTYVANTLVWFMEYNFRFLHLEKKEKWW